MIVGVGIDLVSISRIAEKIKKPSFAEKVFSKSEIDYCESCKDSQQHFAVRFAAKEAFLKAIGKGLTAGYDLNEIEVTHDSLGKPFITLFGSFKEMNDKEGWTSIHASLSHEGDNATAIVIIEK